MRNIHAYTETIPESFPGYVSVNEHPEGSGQFSITVRERGRNGMRQASLSMTREQLLTLANDVQAKLGTRRG